MIVALAAARVAMHLKEITIMTVQAQRDSQAKLWTGWILSGVVIAFLIGDAGGTLFGIEPLKKATLEIGYPLGLMWVVGMLQLLCLVLYAIPATSVLGAIVLTGFLGGAIASHLRVASALTPEMIVSLILGVLAWGGLWFRDPRLRALVP
jgi:DoxX-like family